MAEGKSESQSKIRYEQIADMGSGLIIARVPAECIREQDINARIMKNEMQRQLTDNIKKRGQLESLPFCALTEDGNRIEIISGHHRIRSGKDAGIKEFFVILDVSGLNRSKIVAKQIAHNAISGFDDQSTLKELAKMLEDVDDMIESYAGKDILEEPEAELEKYLSPTVDFDWKNLTFTFLPHQIADLQKLIDALESTKPDFLGVADIEQYKPFLETLTKYQQFANVKNTGAAIHAMIKCTEQMFENIGYTEDSEWVQLTSIFGSSAVPAEAAEIIQEAVKKMADEGVIGSKNKWQQFSETMTLAISQWASGTTASVIKKSSEPASEEAVKFMQYSKERIEEMIAKAEGGEDGVTNNAASGIEKDNVAKGEEETMIDKSLLTPAELAFFEDIEKRCSVAPGEVEKADTKGKATGEEEEEEDAGGKGKKPGVKKSASPQEDIYAGLHPIVAAELQRLQKRADEADEKELMDVAKRYEIIGKKPEELVPVLKSLKNAGGSAYADMINILDASVEAVNKSSMFTEIGKSGGFGGETDAWSKIEKKADEIQAASPTMSRTAAIDMACQQNPQLVHEYENGN